MGARLTHEHFPAFKSEFNSWNLNWLLDPNSLIEFRPDMGYVPSLFKGYGNNTEMIGSSAFVFFSSLLVFHSPLLL